MKFNRNWAILLGTLAVIAVIGVSVYSGLSAMAGEILDMNLLTFLPVIYSQLEQPVLPSPEFVVITPVWELGASSADPTIGTNGEIKGWYTKHVYDFGTKIDLELYINVKGGSAGIGTGSYEIYLPDELEPALDWYVGHANVWIAGGGISEFDGSVKWTFRNSLKGPKLIFTFDGREWSRTTPKTFADLKLRANISYWLQDIDPPNINPISD
jgi:hypothetical protein